MPKKPKKTLRWRLALDLGTTSLGWAVLRLGADGQPCGIVRCGVRIFGDGRNPKTSDSLAVTRRAARAMRRRRDRLLRRKARMMQQLVDFGFFPQDAAERKEFERSNPYELRARGLDAALSPGEFARALFHLNQRRGFKSNRRTDKGADEKEAGALKKAISQLRQRMEEDGARTVGEWLWKKKGGKNVRARATQKKGGAIESYDLYIDRAMVEAEFDALWAKQAALNPAVFTEEKRAKLRDTLLHQRPLRPVDPGRCTLLPDEPRAPLALPSVQRFRILQEVNNLRVKGDDLKDLSLSAEQRDTLVELLEKKGKVTFIAMKKALGLGSSVQFNLEDAQERRKDLAGNGTTCLMAKDACFGERWHELALARQDAITQKLLDEESEEALLRWLVAETGVDGERAREICNASARLKSGYGRLSLKAISRIVPKLQEFDEAGCPRTYDQAVRAAGFESHSAVDNAFDFAHDAADELQLVNNETGEITRVLRQLPYYGRVLHRHVAFGSGKPEDGEEKRFGKINNPTVHIGLNQVRLVVNALVRRYGHPAEIIVEVARELKQNREQKKETERQQKNNQDRNEKAREAIASVLGIPANLVSRADIQKWILWEELNEKNAEDRRCPYTGEQISASMLLSDAVEIEHILPFSQTLDSSLNNRTVSLRRANRVKGNRAPWEARADFEQAGWRYEDILQRAANMPQAKSWRFAEGAMQRFLREQDFSARALTDTAYLSRLARLYLMPVCKGGNVRAIPGRMTALLRAKFGLNSVLGLDGEKNRNDHRHHAVDACVIGVTDQGLLQRFARASASAREKELDRLVENMPLPWERYRESVERAVQAIWVSYKPEHSHEADMLEDTAYGFRGEKAITSKKEGGERVYTEKARSAVVAIANQKAPHATNRPWHGSAHFQQGVEYKGYQGGSNWCMEIVRDEKGRWKGEVISTFQAYRLMRTLAAEWRAKHGKDAAVPPLVALLDKKTSVSGKPLVMRLMKGDMVKMAPDGGGDEVVMRLYIIKRVGQMAFAPHHEANVAARAASKEDALQYTLKNAGPLKAAKCRRVNISPIGTLHDPGFSG